MSAFNFLKEERDFGSIQLARCMYTIVGPVSLSTSLIRLLLSHDRRWKLDSIKEIKGL